MARAIEKLTLLAVAQAKRPGHYGDGLGLYLQVSAGGTKSWIFRYRHGSKRREAGLGPCHTVSLAEAREEALQYRKQLRQGVDPIEARKAARLKRRLDTAKAMTFRACAEAYIEAHKSAWRSPKSLVQWQGSLKTYADPALGDHPVQDIDTTLVMRVIEPLWSKKPETASRVRRRIESILNWAIARGYRDGPNPARWRGHLDQLLPRKSKVRPVEHFTALGHQEIGTFMAKLRQQGSIPAKALEFAILTAARTGEVIGARWAEINVAERLWTIPASRMKSNRQHAVPLSGAAMAIVTAMAEVRQGDFLFPGSRLGRPLNSSVFLVVLRRMELNVTPHGFRSTFSDWCAERSTFSAEVREMALAHAIGNKAEAAYRRGDLLQKRKQLSEAWAAYCGAAPTTAAVIAIR